MKALAALAAFSLAAPSQSWAQSMDCAHQVRRPILTGPARLGSPALITLGKTATATPRYFSGSVCASSTVSSISRRTDLRFRPGRRPRSVQAASFVLWQR
jgi:hypothetical protein